MRPTQVLTRHDAAELFDRAVQDRALAVLTLQDGVTWQTFKSRFLESDPRGHFVVLDYQPCERETLPAVAPGQCVGVSFRQRNHKLLFATVAQARGHYLLGDQTRIPAVRYRWPTAVTELQRRAYFRTPVPVDVRLPVTLWAGGLRAKSEDASATAPEIVGEAVDLSCGGMLVRLPESPAWQQEQTVGVEMRLPDGGPPVRLEARCRGGRSADDGQAVALQFIGLELSADGNTLLQRLANVVQRLHRLGARSRGSIP